MILELGSIDMTMVQNHTRNTPLLVLAKVIEADGPEAIEVAGAANSAHCMFAFNIPYANAAAMLNKGVNVRACDSGGYDCLTVALRRALPQLQVVPPPQLYAARHHS